LWDTKPVWNRRSIQIADEFPLRSDTSTDRNLMSLWSHAFFALPSDFQILRAPIGHRFRISGQADSRIRTDDLIITNDLLYQLSYIGNCSLWIGHNWAVAAALCCQNATTKICFRILSRAIHNHPGRRTKAERDLIQGGFAPKPPVRSVPASIQVCSVGKRLLSGLVPPDLGQTDSHRRTSSLTTC
jgi:hypothetical protein